MSEQHKTRRASTWRRKAGRFEIQEKCWYTFVAWQKSEAALHNPTTTNNCEYVCVWVGVEKKTPNDVDKISQLHRNVWKYSDKCEIIKP